MSEYEAILNDAGLPCVSGRGNGLGFYAHYLNPGLSFQDMENAERAAKIANIAYQSGYRQAQEDIRNAIGLDQ